MAYSALRRSGSVGHLAPPQAVPRPRATSEVFLAHVPRAGPASPRDLGVRRPSSEKMPAIPRNPGTVDGTSVVPQETVTARTRPDSSVSTPSRRTSTDNHLADRWAGNSSMSIRFLIFVVIICGLTCLYIWQAHTISVIRSDTDDTLAKMRDLEEENVRLMLDYARWDTPGWIETESNKAGMVVGQAPIRVPIHDEPKTSGVSRGQGTLATSGQLGDLLPASLMARTQAR
jgi:hypothetical protein